MALELKDIISQNRMKYNIANFKLYYRKKLLCFKNTKEKNKKWRNLYTEKQETKTVFKRM